MTNNKIEARINKFKEWFKEPSNLLLFAIILGAFLIRLYYFFLSKDQALWYDEGEYLSTSKHWAFGVPFDINPQRPPLFHYIASIIFRVGLGEETIRFFLVLLPSTFLVFAVYLLGKEMYNKKVGLIAAVFSSVSWTWLFWTARIQPDFFSMSFQVLSVFFMWKHWKKSSTKYVVLAGMFAALGWHFKVSGLLVPMIFIVFLFFKERFSAATNKYNYYFAIGFLALMIPYFVWSMAVFDTPTAFKQGYTNEYEKFAVGWYNLNFYYSLTEGLFFVLFIVGVILGLKFLLYADVLIKDKKMCFNPDIFSVLVLVFVSVFYIFFMRNSEDRWLFLWLPFIFFLTGNFLVKVGNFIECKKKYLGLLIIVVLVGFVAYSQYNHADGLIKNKMPSYGPVKEAGIWMKDNSQPGDIILSISKPQTTYYSEREIFAYDSLDGIDSFNEYVEREKPKFLQVSIFEPHPDWINTWISQNQNRVVPVQAYFLDAQKTQPSMIVYQISYSESS